MGTNDPVELPLLGGQTADTHTHLDMLDDPAGALERAAIAGVALIATVVDITEEPQNTFDSLDGWIAEAGQRLADGPGAHDAPPEVRIIVGAHPHNASAVGDAELGVLTRLAADPRVVAIGETGLDFHYDHSPRDAQIEIFRRQVLLAHELGLPVAVHLREAHEEGIAVLEDVGVPPAGCLIHCFTEGVDLAERFVDLGCHISFAGPATFKRAENIREAARAVPLDRILVETDAPFLAPEPYRGRTNEPAFTVLTAARIAEARGLETAVFAEMTMRNARRVFSGTRGA